MNITESVNIALGAIKANKLRSILTLLGVIIGVMTIIAMQSLITGLRNSVEEQLTVLGSNVFQVQKYPAIQTSGGSRWKYRNRKNLTVEEAEAVRKYCTAAKLVGAEVWAFGKVLRYKENKTLPNVYVAGGTPEFAENNGYFVSDGRFLTWFDVDHNRQVIILGMDIVEKLFPHEYPIGKEIKLDGTRFEVIGVLEEQGSAFGQSRDNRAVIPISTFQKLWGKRRSVNITVQAKSAALYDTAINQVIGILRAVRKVPPEKPNDFEIWSSNTLIEAFDNLTRVVRLAAIAIASISLLVASVGIMNIMLVSVTERTREIGIRKAIGAKRRDVLWQFLIEAIVFCEIGGIIGIVLGIGIAEIVAIFSPLPAAVPIWTIFVAIVVCSLVGIFFGIYPAAKAARLNPIEALRYE